LQDHNITTSDIKPLQDFHKTSALKKAKDLGQLEQ